MTLTVSLLAYAAEARTSVHLGRFQHQIANILKNTHPDLSANLHILLSVYRDTVSIATTLCLREQELTFRHKISSADASRLLHTCDTGHRLLLQYLEQACESGQGSGYPHTSEHPIPLDLWIQVFERILLDAIHEYSCVFSSLHRLTQGVLLLDPDAELRECSNGIYLMRSTPSAESDLFVTWLLPPQSEQLRWRAVWPGGPVDSPLKGCVDQSTVLADVLCQALAAEQILLEPQIRLLYQC